MHFWRTHENLRYFAGGLSYTWNAVTSLGENKVIQHPLPYTSFCETQWRHSVKTR